MCHCCSGQSCALLAAPALLSYEPLQSPVNFGCGSAAMARQRHRSRWGSSASQIVHGPQAIGNCKGLLSLQRQNVLGHFPAYHQARFPEAQQATVQCHHWTSKLAHSCSRHS